MQGREEKKKLLITASTFPRFEGDTEPRFVLDLAKELQKYFEVTVLVPASREAEDLETLEGVKVERYHYFPLHRFETLCYPGAIVPRIKEKKVRILLVPFLLFGLYIAISKRKKKYDLVHAHWIIPQAVVQSFFSTPYLLTGHGGDVTSLNKGPVKWLKKRAIRKASQITVVSSVLKNDILELLDEDEKKNIETKVQVQPMGCYVNKFQKKIDVDIKKNEKELKTVLFVGRLAEKKGVTYLIDAMKYVNAKLIIVGDGPLRIELQDKVENLSLQSKVSFLGARNHDELPAIYAAADVFVAPSVTARDKDKEGFGLVILEAMSAGIPVVASRSGGITELIEDGYNGLLVEERNADELAKAINYLLEDEEATMRMKENMRNTVVKYDYHQVGKRYAEILMQL